MALCPLKRSSILGISCLLGGWSSQGFADLGRLDPILPELLRKIAVYLDHRDLAHFSQASKAILQKMTHSHSTDVTVLVNELRKMQIEKLPKARHSVSGAVFTRRLDLEHKFKKVIKGEIWQEPDFSSTEPGNIWFQIQNTVEEEDYGEGPQPEAATFKNAPEHCAAKGRALGVEGIQVPSAEAITRFVDLMGGKHYKREILPDLWKPVLVWTTSISGDHDESQGIVFLGSTGQTSHQDLQEKMTLRCFWSAKDHSGKH